MACQKPGQYLIHITLVPDPTDTKVRTQGERLDVHMGFKAGGGQPVSKNNLLLICIFCIRRFVCSVSVKRRLQT